jgi:hypothetical protein
MHSGCRQRKEDGRARSEEREGLKGGGKWVTFGGVAILLQELELSLELELEPELELSLELELELELSLSLSSLSLSLSAVAATLSEELGRICPRAISTKMSKPVPCLMSLGCNRILVTSSNMETRLFTMS